MGEHGSRFARNLERLACNRYDHGCDPLGEGPKDTGCEAGLAGTALADQRHPLHAEARLLERTLRVQVADEVTERHVVDAQVVADRRGVEGVLPLEMDEQVEAPRPAWWLELTA
jgi:hypothetical protein